MKHDDTSTRSWNAIADDWVAHTDTNDYRNDFLFPLTFRLLTHLSGRRVLDLGCGEGGYSRELARRGARVTAVDGSERLIEVALPLERITEAARREKDKKSGTIRKIPLMRVEHDGEYALVASKGGAPEHPVWYYNLESKPDEVTIQDGPEPFEAEVREVTGAERAAWWERAVAAYPPYAEYQQKTTRQIPVFVLEPSSGN